MKILILLIFVHHLSEATSNEHEVLLEEVVRDTEYGSIVGKRFRRNLHGLEVNVTCIVDKFHKVPYAKPPVGDLRFMPPEPPEKWENTLSTSNKTYCSCPQTLDSHLLRKVCISEDCLYLNIFAPHMPNDPKATFPVMLYVHGGSYEVGSGSDYDGSVLATMGVVVVTFNYRLGPFGFLLSGDEFLTGNYGLKDQIMVMQWVQDNIANFGGDPNNVMLIGHSVGAALVETHMTLRDSRKLFHSAAAQSGSASASYGIYHDSMGKNFKEYIFNISKLLGCGYDGEGGGDYKSIVYEGALYKSRMKKVVQCLKTVSFDVYIDTRNVFPMYDKLEVEFRPYLDGNVLKKTIHEAFTSGDFNKVPLITGIVEREFDFYMEELSDKVEADSIMESYLYNCFAMDERVVDLLRYYYIDWPRTLGITKEEFSNYTQYNKYLDVGNGIKLSDAVVYYKNGEMLSDYNMVIPTSHIADMIQKHSPDVYFYYFTDPHSYHSIELSYLFGAPFGAYSADDKEKVSFKPNDPPDSPRKKLSRNIMKIWTHFAKHKKIPEIDGVVWPKYDSKTRKYMRFSEEGSQMHSHLAIDKLFLWNELLPKLFPKSSENVVGKGGTLFGSYPSTLDQMSDEETDAESEEETQKKAGVLTTVLTILLVLAAILIIVLLLILCKVRNKIRKLEKNHKAPRI